MDAKRIAHHQITTIPNATRQRADRVRAGMGRVADLQQQLADATSELKAAVLDLEQQQAA